MVRILQQFILTTIFAIFASQASAMFIQADWFDPTESGVGTNRYAYSNNDPVNRFDPSGNQSIDSQTNEYLSEDEYNQAADDVDREIERLQNEWGNDPLRNDKAYEYDVEQLRRKAETYRHYAGASAQERLDHFRQGLVAPAAGALTLGVGVQQPAASTMPRTSPVVGSVPTEAAARLGIDLSKVAIQNGVAQTTISVTRTMRASDIRAVTDYTKSLGARRAEIGTGYLANEKILGRLKLKSAQGHLGSLVGVPLPEHLVVQEMTL